MIRLHAGSGSWEIQLLGPHGSDEDWAKLRANVVQLLRARKRPGGGLLDRFPWRLYGGTNYFNDEFCVLYARLPIDKYVEAADLEHNQEARSAATSLATAFGELGTFVRFVAFEADVGGGIESISSPDIQCDAAATAHALADADHLMRTRGAVSAVDRVHTAMHGYLRQVCRAQGIEFAVADTTTALWKRIRNKHPGFTASAHGEHIGRIVMALATVLDALGTVRNNATVAHANEQLLSEAEAMLAVNAARTILHYVSTVVGA